VKGVIVISLLQTVLQYALLYIGLLYTTSVKGAILKSTDVFFVTFISSLVFKLEKLTLKKLISCIIGFTGIIVMNLKGLSLNISPLGDGLVVLGIVFYSFAVVITKLVAKDENPIVLSGYQMALGGVIMLIVSVIFGGNIKFFGILPIILCLSVIYAVSYSLWTILLKHNPASRVTIHSFMTPVFGVLTSAFLLSEDGGVAPFNLILALFLVCFGIVLWGYEKKNS
jgi:drug/metabolite transporter (DMT)-like permease